jgi:hypothetical protein
VRAILDKLHRVIGCIPPQGAVGCIKLDPFVPRTVIQADDLSRDKAAGDSATEYSVQSQGI